MLDIPLKPSAKMLRQFAVAWLIIFPAIGVFQFFIRAHTTIGILLMGVGVIGGIAGVIKPALLRPIFVAWMVAAFPIGWCFSQVMLAVLFYGLLTPVSWGLRMIGRDALSRRNTVKKSSFWHERSATTEPQRYFRQY
jgi:hypothetical protein